MRLGLLASNSTHLSGRNARSSYSNAKTKVVNRRNPLIPDLCLIKDLPFESEGSIVNQKIQDRFLAEIFNRLEDRSRSLTSEDDIIFEAVSSYMVHLMETGNVPHRFMDELEADLREEAREILRKKTYGSPSVQDYQRTKERKRKARAS